MDTKYTDIEYYIFKLDDNNHLELDTTSFSIYGYETETDALNAIKKQGLVKARFILPGFKNIWVE